MPHSTAQQSKTKPLRLDRYEGKWIALQNDRVVAYGDTLEALMKKIDAKGLRKKVSVFLVPREDEGPYILSFRRFSSRSPNEKERS